MKILLTRRLHDFAIKELKKRYDVEVHTGSIPMPKKQIIKRIRDKDGLICYPYDRIDADIISAGKKLRAISTFSVGYDHIDTKAASRRGIVVSYTPEVLTAATADLTIALMLDIFRRVGEGDALIRNGRWVTILGPYEFLGSDLSGKTLGIFGMGRIGQAVAKRARAFDMKIVYHGRRRMPPGRERSLKARHVSLEELFRRSDVVSIHAPHTPQTHEIVNLKLLKKMKKTAFLVNTARGRIINEKDLADALKKRIIAGAALDVFQSEPIGPDNPLARLCNVVITPHIGSATEETRRKMAEIAVKNLVLSLSGRKPIFQVRAG
ncbi:MAG TPA: D-glycerate dehydrogenase [Candidatus Nitrosotalea sp.]|nr:D-glycerate dehydrogenase [Candidatus Nitrosotalea sp.]